MKVEWGGLKMTLLFLGLVLKGLAVSPPLDVPEGALVRDVAGIVWPAVDGSFFYLLKPPSKEKKEDEK